MKVFISDKTSIFPFRYKKTFVKAANVLGKIIDLKKRSEVNVLIVSENEMQKLSKKYRNKDKVTDVLSFPNDFENLALQINYYMLGDIYLCKKQIKNQAKTFNHSYQREFTYLFVHGLLHVLGYNHKQEKETKIMNNLAKRVIEKIGVLRNDQ